MSCVLSEKVKPGEAKEFGTSRSACPGNGFGIARGGERSPGRAGGQRSYKCLKFALYIAAAHTGLWETAFLQHEEMAFYKTP